MLGSLLIGTGMQHGLDSIFCVLAGIGLFGVLRSALLVPMSRNIGTRPPALNPALPAGSADENRRYAH